MADGGGGPQTLRKPEIYEARQARRDLSLPEILLWQRLKGSPQGIAFRKQHPVCGYRADFYCAKARLIIEVDGLAHDAGDRPERDLIRTARLSRAGYEVLRLLAVDLLRDPDAAAQSIIAYAARPLRQPLRDCHLPVNGEEPMILPVHGEGDRDAKHRGGGGGPATTRSAR